MGTLRQRILIIIIGWSLTSCVGPQPISEFTLADAALSAALRYGAPRLAPKPWYEAERYYRRGVRLFKENFRRKARAHFIQARKYAEKAENLARIKKFQSGDSLP